MVASSGGHKWGCFFLSRIIQVQTLYSSYILIHPRLFERTIFRLSLFNTSSKFVMQERIPPVLQECKLLYRRNVRQFRWFFFIKKKTHKNTISFPENSPFKAFRELLISCESKNKQKKIGISNNWWTLVFRVVLHPL